MFIAPGHGTDNHVGLVFFHINVNLLSLWSFVVSFSQYMNFYHTQTHRYGGSIQNLAFNGVEYILTLWADDDGWTPEHGYTIIYGSRIG